MSRARMIATALAVSAAAMAPAANSYVDGYGTGGVAGDIRRSVTGHGFSGGWSRRRFKQNARKASR